MAHVRGNPVLIFALFFGAAVLLMGGIYAMAPSVLKGPTPLSITVIVALSASLLFTMLVIGRVFWVVSKDSRRARGAGQSDRK